MSFVRIQDLPTGTDQLEEEAEVLLNDLENGINAVIVVGQLDPLELGDDGQPRWSAEQQNLIIKAKDVLENWKS